MECKDGVCKIEDHEDEMVKRIMDKVRAAQKRKTREEE